MDQGGYFSQIGTALKTPFSGGMTWTQLAAVTVFILTIALAWRLSIGVLMKE